MKMEDLKATLITAGLSAVSTYIQSGNIAFECEQEDNRRVGERIQSAISGRFGFNVECVVKTPEALRSIVSDNPFPNERTDLISVVLFDAPAQADRREWKNGVDEAVLGDGAVYLLCRSGLHTTKLTNAFFERALGMPCTSRNWATVLHMLTY